MGEDGRDEGGIDRNDEGGTRERTLLCGGRGQEVGIGGDSEVFGVMISGGGT